MSNELIEILELSNSEIDNLARRILIIDDNPDIHRDYKSILASEDSDSLLGDLEKELFGDSDTMAVQKDAYYMDFASQGQEGLSKVQEAVSQDRSFMVAFVDMRMPPGWDGLETIEHIWQVDPEIQVVICTAYSDYSWTEMIQRLGKTDKLVVLKKPFDAVEVAQLANALTQKWILHRQATLKMDELDAIVAERTRELEKINSDLHQEMEERKQAEAALRQSERRFSDISYSMADWIWEVDTNGNYTFCSGKVKKILGYEPDELIGKTPFDLMPDKEAERMKATFARITGEKAAIEDLENWNLTQNGSEVCFLTNGIPILDENGELLGYRGVDKDITNRKQQEQELQRTMSELEQSNQALQETLAKVERAHDLVQLRSVQLEAVNDEYKEAQVQLFAANASLKESEELYRMLADNVADVIWTKDMNLHNTYVSPSIIRITGYTVEEFMQMTIDQAYPPTSVELINETFHEELAIEASCDASPTRQRVLVLEQYRKDGSTFWIEDKLACLRDPEGAPIGIMGITRDITERRNAEEEIERNYQEQAVLSSLLSLSLEGTSLDEIIDLSLGEVFSIPWLGIEPRGCVFLVEGNELVMVSEQNMNPYVVKSCDRIEFGHCLCGRAARSGETIFKDCIDHEHETRFEGVMPHGHYCLPIQSMHGTLGVLNLYIKHGHKRDSREEQFLASVAAVIAGTIERKRADEALRESEEKYRLITENVDSLIAMVDCEGKYVYTNTAHQRVTGYEPKELIGKSSSDYVHPEDAKRLAAFSAAGDTGLVSYTYRLRCTDGSYKWMEGRGKLIYDETGKLHRAFTIANDITERLRAEETMRD
ncbi:MAG: PAS domain S-box protein, partial [Chloroflexi bacterium]|nr:PAS domain S-box protein [Chloroflexota bacterium]